MNHFLRLGSYAILGCVGLGAIAHGSNAQITGIFGNSPLFLLHPSSQGYLGAGMQDIDKDRAAALKLKDVRGAEIVTLDHDAPANQAGLKLHDVILQMNGQQVEGVEQLRRMLRETPAGRTVTLLVSRDGQTMSINLQLADRAAIARAAWDNHFSVQPPDDNPMTDGFLGASPRGQKSFLGTIGPSSVYVGAAINPLTRQMADFLGVTEGQGLLVESVDDNSPAFSAGLKAGDVITKVNKTGVISRKDWTHEINSNKGKQVELTIVRNRKEQTLSMMAGDPKKKGEVDWQVFGPSDNDSVVALLNDGQSKIFLNNKGLQQQFDSQDMEKFRKQFEQNQKDLQKQMEQWKDRIEIYRPDEMD